MGKLLAIAVVVGLVPQPALADGPTNGTEGVWAGTCVRGQVTANATASIDQQGARLNGQGVTNFSKNGLKVTFVVSGKFTKTFQGTWSQDTNSLTGTLSVTGKTPAQCSLARRTVSTGRVCIRNPDQKDIWWMLKPGNPADPVIVRAGSEDRGTGDPGGRLCWGVTEGEARACTRSLPQTGFGC